MKNLLLGSTRLFREFGRDAEGSTAITFGLGLTVMLVAMGAAIDFSIGHKAHAKAQDLADSVALGAAVYVKHNGKPPMEDGTTTGNGFVHGKNYTAAELKYDFGGTVYGGNDNVHVVTEYDLVLGEAVTQVSTKTKTTFMALAGIDSLDVSTSSTVKLYNKTVKHPVSLAVVADNSGSMNWDDLLIIQDGNTYRSHPDAVQRLKGLKDAVNSFMARLDGLNDENSGKKFIRTGLLPYNRSTLTGKQVTMKWGVLTNDKVNDMKAQGGTDSSPPLSTAHEWMLQESAIHKTESQRDPLKYVIFMTDGQNEIENPVWVEEKGTKLWRYRWPGTSKWRYYHASPNNDFDADGWGVSGTYHESTYEDNTDYTGFWEATEGKLLSGPDYDSIQECDEMKAAGIRVFTVGFGLVPGTYYYGSGDINQAKNRRYLAPAVQKSAYSLLQSCASSPDDFITAVNAETLDEAFKLIGNTIVKEVIRISK